MTSQLLPSKNVTNVHPATSSSSTRWQPLSVRGLRCSMLSVLTTSPRYLRNDRNVTLCLYDTTEISLPLFLVHRLVHWKSVLVEKKLGIDANLQVHCSSKTDSFQTVQLLAYMLTIILKSQIIVIITCSNTV